MNPFCVSAPVNFNAVENLKTLRQMGTLARSWLRFVMSHLLALTFITEVSMEWFLYDRDVRHERVKIKKA